MATIAFSNEAGTAWQAQNAPQQRALRSFAVPANPLHYHISNQHNLSGAGMNYPSLFSPLQIGPYRLGHRVVMAPLTRMRAEKQSLAPRPLNTEYYAQRAKSASPLPFAMP
jgi:hypothetical protein